MNQRGRSVHHLPVGPKGWDVRLPLQKPSGNCLHSSWSHGPVEIVDLPLIYPCTILVGGLEPHIFNTVAIENPHKNGWFVYSKWWCSSSRTVNVYQRVNSEPCSWKSPKWFPRCPSFIFTAETKNCWRSITPNPVKPRENKHHLVGGFNPSEKY